MCALASNTQQVNSTSNTHTDQQVNSTVSQSSDQPQQPNSVKVIFDNVDLSVKSRFLRYDKFGNKSLHYVNSYGTQGRINFASLSDTKPHSCANSPERNAALLLPSAEDDKTMRNLFITHVSRILYTNMEYFKFKFDDVVEWHVHHEYYKEMSSRSSVVRTLHAYICDINCDAGATGCVT